VCSVVSLSSQDLPWRARLDYRTVQTATEEAENRMEIHQIAPFLDYYERIRDRTLAVIRCIPPEKIEWTYREGRFTLGDLIRHIAAIERFMYVETVQGRPSLYAGCGRDLADGYHDVLAFMHQTHQESVDALRTLTDDDLQKRCLTPAGSYITAWKWLRAMVEHEIHHRGQIYLYLGLLEIPTPPIFGLTSEEVRDKSSR
jgi:uncharacterized damage-inducible protein DinB